jgi:hypothetical protein
VPWRSNPTAPVRWQLIDGLHVCFTEAEVPVSEELWDLCMASRRSPEITGCLSIIGGDGFAQISRRQWRVSASLAVQCRFPFAMISSHRITLAMVRAASWNGANIRAFKWAELDDALSFLGVAPERSQAVRDVAEMLRSRPARPNAQPAQPVAQAQLQAQAHAQAQARAKAEAKI